MLVYDETYHWEGWGGKLQLGSGKCRLRICDLEKSNSQGLTYLRPILVVVSDIPGSKMTVRSCVSHIATGVAQQFGIDPNRMLLIEYYPRKTYGETSEKQMPEIYEVAEFERYRGKAIRPRWRPLQSSMRDVLKDLLGVPESC